QGCAVSRRSQDRRQQQRHRSRGNPGRSDRGSRSDRRPGGLNVKVKVSSFDAKAKAADVELNDEIFGLDPRADILHRVVTWQLEKRRATARGTRERADVARTGKKFGRQKGGGTARHGDRRAP